MRSAQSARRRAVSRVCRSWRANCTCEGRSVERARTAQCVTCIACRASSVQTAQRTDGAVCSVRRVRRAQPAACSCKAQRVLFSACTMRSTHVCCMRRSVCPVRTAQRLWCTVPCTVCHVRSAVYSAQCGRVGLPLPDPLAFRGSNPLQNAVSLPLALCTTATLVGIRHVFKHSLRCPELTFLYPPAVPAALAPALKREVATKRLPDDGSDKRSCARAGPRPCSRPCACRRTPSHTAPPEHGVVIRTGGTPTFPFRRGPSLRRTGSLAFPKCQLKRHLQPTVTAPNHFENHPCSSPLPFPYSPCPYPPCRRSARPTTTARSTWIRWGHARWGSPSRRATGGHHKRPQSARVGERSATQIGSEGTCRRPGPCRWSPASLPSGRAAPTGPVPRAAARYRTPLPERRGRPARHRKARDVGGTEGI